MSELKFLKHLMYFLLFFVLLYFETLHIAGIKFAIIWKGVFIIFILGKFLSQGKSLFTKKYFLYGYLFNIKKIVTLSTFTSFLPSLIQLSRSIIFPLLLSYFNSFYSNKQLLNLIQTLSIYIIISTIPFVFGFLDPLNQGYDLSRYGLSSFGFIGVFQNPHSASMTLALALLVILYFFNHTISNYKKIFYSVLIVIGIYALIQTYVRTGIVMLLVGVFVLYIYKSKISRLLRIIPVLAIIAVGLFSYYQGNVAFKMRFQESNIYHQTDAVTLDNIGSGRFQIATYAIKNWWGEGPLSIFMGLGESLAREKMANTKGSAVFAHNGFIEILQTDGLLGLLLYCNFMFLMYRVIAKNRKSPYYKLTLSLFLMFLTGLFLQGGDNIYLYTIIAISVILVGKNRVITEKLNY